MARNPKEAPTRAILSSEAKANFAQVIDDVYSRGTRYIIQRFDTPRAVLISLTDYRQLLHADDTDTSTLRESRASYHLGEERTPADIAAMFGDDS